MKSVWRSAFRVAVIFLIFTAVIFSSNGLCKTTCIDSTGEATVNDNDVPSAKAEAIARAKWASIEQVAGIEIKAQSIVQNMVLVDDAISKQIRGVISEYKVLDEKNRKDTVWVKINSCVEPVKAKEAGSSMALNNSIAVFIPARKPSSKSLSYSRSTQNEYDESNILSENLIGSLTEQGYTVVDVAPTHAVEAGEIEASVKSGNFITLRSLMYKFLSNIILIGKIDYTISTPKGQDVGYGISMPFNNVTVRLTYRIVTKDSSGKTVILTSGTEDGQGVANSVEDATAMGLKNLSEKVSPVILDKVGQHIKGIGKRVHVRVEGVSDLNANFAVKDILQNLAWVTNVEEKGMGDFVVSYPENTVYLANSIGQKGFQIINFSSYVIDVRYQK